MEKVSPEPNSGCWLWTASVDGSGYGVLTVEKRQVRAHRISWALRSGPIPAGQWVLHRCDVPTCVNPDHLFLGTREDNFADMMRKGRHSWMRDPGLMLAGHRRLRENPELFPRGEQHGRAKLTLAAVQEIRRRASDGASVCRLARDFGVCETQMKRIVNRESWKRVGAGDA